MANKLPRCAQCKRPFHPDRYNRHHQKYCLSPDCALERKRQRQRADYQRRYSGDTAFKDRERERCRTGLQCRRLPKEPVVVPALSSPSDEALAGLVALLHDTDDPLHVAHQLDKYRERGRRLAVERVGCGPPVG